MRVFALPGIDLLIKIALALTLQRLNFSRLSHVGPQQAVPYIVSRDSVRNATMAMALANS